MVGMPLPQWIEQLAGDPLGDRARVMWWRRGQDFEVYRVTAGGEDFALRVPLTNVADTGYDGRVDFGIVVEREAAAYELFTKAGVPVPRLLSWGKRSARYDRAWMITRFVDHDERDSLSAGQQRALGTVIRHLHSYRPPAGFTGPGGEGAPAPMVERIAMRYRRACLHVELPSADDILLVVWDSIMSEDAAATSHLLHMDLRPANLCFRQDRLLALIDMTNCIVGSRFAELGRLYAYDGLSREFLAGYGVAEFTSTEWTRTLCYAVDTIAMLITVAAEELMDRDMLARMGRSLLSVTAELARTAR